MPHPTRFATLRAALTLAAMALVAVGLPACYTYPTPYGYAVPASFDRSWEAAVGALADNGLAITSQDRDSGAVSGRGGAIDVVANVRSQSDGSVRVEFTARGDIRQDPGLVDRVSAAYDRRMGR
jgi:hypothetical protein